MQTANSQIVYIIAGDCALSHSLRYLLESHHFIVKTVQNSEHALAQLPLRKNDIIMLDLDKNEPAAYRILNTLLAVAIRPRIILTTAIKSALQPNDIFPGDRIELLFHPVAPKSLLKAIDKFSLDRFSLDTRSLKNSLSINT